MDDLVLSPLGKTWILDLDGVLFPHNGYLEGNECPLPGVMAFFRTLPERDFVIVVTARPEPYRARTLRAFDKFDLRVDLLVMGAPVGERVLVNDIKPSGLPTAYAINVHRNEGLAGVRVIIDRGL